MKTPIAARFSAFTLLAALLYALLVMAPGLRIVGVSFPRQVWLLENAVLWKLGLWLWLAMIFGWLWLVVSLLWTYLPSRRMASMLQCGLLVIGTTLAIGGITVWMAGLPAILGVPSVNELLPLVDALALGMMGAGACVGGSAIVWIGVDLLRYSSLARSWVGVAIGAGLLLLPSPWLLTFPWHLVGAAICWLVWALYLARMPRLPSAYSEMG